MDARNVSDAAMARLAEALSAQDADETAAAAPTDLSMLGRYRILRPIAEGASARVYEAEDLQLKRRVAIKLMHGSAEDAYVRRFHREASLAARLKHPAIVTIHEVSMIRREDGVPAHYIVMDYYEHSMEELLRNATLPRRQRLAMLETVARAVQYAHEQGVVHRDLKPANILVDGDGRPVVSDFGLAREDAQTTHLTRSGAPIGTPHYMSPEQVAGRTRDIGPASDVYALGVILYRMLVDRLPYMETTAGAVYAAILTRDPRRPRAVGATVDRDLETICLKAMDRDPRQRYRSAGDFADDLRRTAGGEPIRARAPGLLRRLRRHAGWLGLAAVALVAVAGTAAAVAASRRSDAIHDRERRYGEAYRAAADAWGRLEQGTRAGVDDRAWYERATEDLATLIDRALEADPTRPDPHVLRYRLEYLLGRTPQSREALARAVKLQPDHVEATVLDLRERLQDFALRQLGTTPILAGDRVIGREDAEARAQCEAEISRAKRNPRIPERQIALLDGFLDLADRRWEQALEHMRAYLESEPWDAQVWALLSSVCSYSGRAEEAERHIGRAIQLRKERNFLIVRASLRRRRGDFSGALEDCREALGPAEDHPGALQERGQIHLETGRADQAIADFTRLLELQPGSAVARICRARAYRLQKRWEEAHADLESVGPGEMLWTMAQIERGITEQTAGHCEQADESFTRAIDQGLDAYGADAHFRRAGVRFEHSYHVEKLPDRERAALLRAALADATEALVREPDHRLAPGLRGLTAARLEHMDRTLDDDARRRLLREAAAYLRQALERAPDFEHAPQWRLVLDHVEQRLAQ